MLKSKSLIRTGRVGNVQNQGGDDIPAGIEREPQKQLDIQALSNSVVGAGSGLGC